LIATFVILAVFGLNINSVIILLSTILLSVAFMIGSASSKYIEVRLISSVTQRLWIKVLGLKKTMRFYVVVVVVVGLGNPSYFGPSTLQHWR